MNEQSPTHRVGMAAFGLRMAVSDLWEMRLNNETADHVLEEEGSILAAYGALSTLVEDIRAARDKQIVDAPKLVAAE